VVEEKKSITKFAKSVKTEKECTVLAIRTTGNSSAGKSKVTWEKDNAEESAKIKSDIPNPNKPITGTFSDKKGIEDLAIPTGIPSGINGIEDASLLTGIPEAFRSDTLPIQNKESHTQTSYRNSVEP
jgi:hypothetical protein